MLHRDLLRLRREDATIRAGSRPGALDGAVLGPEAFVLRRFDPGAEGDDRLMLINLGVELRLPVAAEPLLVPPEGGRWRVLWSSEDPRYGGSGTAEPETEEHNWRLAAHAAILMMPIPSEADEHRDPDRLALTTTDSIAMANLIRTINDPCPSPIRRVGRRWSNGASGSSPTAWAATRRARSAACRPVVITGS